MMDLCIYRIVRGFGCGLCEVYEMLEEFKWLVKIWSKMKGFKIFKKGDMSVMFWNMNV